MKATRGAQYPPVEDYWNQLDSDKIAAAITTSEKGLVKLTEWDFEDAKRLIWNAAEKWLPRDLSEFIIAPDGIEKRMSLDWGGKLQVKGYIDIEGTFRGTIKPFTEYAGDKFVLDWKTSKNTLDTDWRERLIDSWQWRFYHTGNDAKVIIYRGLSRNGETKEVLLAPPVSTKEETLEYIRGTIAMRQSLIQLGATVYPRHRPFACHAYGRECPFYADCDNYDTIPKVALLDSEMSYSRLEHLLLCPEKHRRLVLQNDADDSEETDFGQAVHRGLAEVWRQAFEKFGNAN